MQKQLFTYFNAPLPFYTALILFDLHTADTQAFLIDYT
jgi:hypothetical protein